MSQGSSVSENLWAEIPGLYFGHDWRYL